ncbi:hypothetical protein EJ04DRAFT_510039 [Polyplosphaeria fusca]|uniref:DUF7704 domain-containing protein n=1 Tax=Polyplosphaeria fusca TaxID=682080 RepID=A0A9P4R2A1_9PLEO|nr:hypothetical protein EJ04DRAFT_510039 [Polyplosphaeria fusca]
MPAQYPLLYRLFFTWVDPVICVWGAYMDFFDPALVLSSHIPNPKVDIGHIMILRQRGGGMLNFGFISAFLLRYTNDAQIWKMVQIADLVVDFAYFWAVHGALKAQNRLDPTTWRAEDWGAIFITGTATVMRLAFLSGVGLDGSKKKTNKRS